MANGIGFHRPPLQFLISIVTTAGTILDVFTNEPFVALETVRVGYGFFRCLFVSRPVVPAKIASPTTTLFGCFVDWLFTILTFFRLVFEPANSA